jgi:predicted alpha/beta superfamily hydrolase
MNYFWKMFFCVFLICQPNLSFAKEVSPEEHLIDSEILSEGQKISVYLPATYSEPSDNRYPVLYALDGKYYKNSVNAVITHLTENRLIPNTIVVAIENEDRIRHYTPSPHATADVRSGEADKFLDYIEKELIPFVDSNYKTSDFRILEGHSLGGLLSLYTLQAKPKLFTAHYAFSPSLHWGDNMTVKKIKRYLSSRKDLNQFVYMNLGDEFVESEYDSRNVMRNSFLELQAYFEENKPKGFRVKTEVLSHLPHTATNLTGLLHATNELYRNWVLPFHTMEKGPEAISAHFQLLSEDLYYDVSPEMGQINYAADYMTNGVMAPEKGLKLLEYNAELHPSSAWVIFNLAKGYKLVEKTERAKMYGAKALKLVSDGDDTLKATITEFLEAL